MSNCLTTGNMTNQLFQAFTVQFLYETPGDVNINFGSSVLSEGIEAGPSQVPEPSAAALVSLRASLCGLLHVRRRRNRSTGNCGAAKPDSRVRIP